MKNKIALYLLLASVSFMFASPFSVEFSFSSGAMLLSTNGVFGDLIYQINQFWIFMWALPGIR